MSTLRGTLAGQLAAVGFADTGRAQQLLGELDLHPEDTDAALIAALAAAADPDLALAGLARMRPAPELVAALRDDPGLRDRLCRVLGASAGLAEHLARHPGDWRLLCAPSALRRPGEQDVRAALLTAVGTDPSDAEPRARLPGADPAAMLRIAYRRGLLQLAARDLTGADPLDRVMAELAALACGTLEAALAIARDRLPAGATPARLAVIAMGKCGARELNYASDIDVIFVAEPALGADEAAALRTATQLARVLIRVCSESSTEGALFPVDPNLRPEGRNGPLVRTLASHRAYYQRWAKTWEFQALLKARHAAGDARLSAAYLAALNPLVWQAAQRDGFVADVRSMRRRVVGSLRADEAGRELKLGPGGLRDIEFAVQLLQLVHGRADPGLRAPATLDGLDALARGSYVGRQDAAELAAAYRFLRAVEHLLQLRRLRRTHMLPEDPAVLRAIGRALRTMWLDPAAGGPRPGTDDPRPEPDGAGGLTAAAGVLRAPEAANGLAGGWTVPGSLARAAAAIQAAAGPTRPWC